MSAALQEVVAEEMPDGPRGVVSPPAGFNHKAVFSGTSRHKITDQRFAQQDTDPDLARSLAQSGHHPSSEQNPSAAAKPNLLAQPLNIPGAVLGSLGGILLINFCASMFSALTQVNIYRYGWAFEIFLAAGFLAMLMWAVETYWLLVPTLILLGNALLLAYSALTGRWSDWAFLWLLEPLIVAVAIIVPMQMKRSAAEPKFLAHAGGAILSLTALFLASTTCLFALAASLLR